MRKVTKLWSEDLNIHLKNRYNINKKSKRFVTKPPAFRSELGRYDALISGSFALQFFDGVVWDESDLDIFVEDGDYAPLAIGEYLIEREGYKYISSVGHQGYSTRDLLEVTSYHVLTNVLLTLILNRLEHTRESLETAKKPKFKLLRRNSSPSKPSSAAFIQPPSSTLSPGTKHTLSSLIVHFSSARRTCYRSSMTGSENSWSNIVLEAG